MGRSINDPNIVKVCAGESTSTMLVSYASNTNKNIFFRIGFTGELTSEILTNVTSYQMWVNDTLVTPLTFPFTVNQNDRVFVSITRTVAGAASVKFNVKGISDPVTFTQNSKLAYPRYMLHKENVIALNDYLLNTDQSIKGQGSTTSFQTNCVWGDPIKGRCEMVYEPSHWNFTGQLAFGLNDLSLPFNTVNRYPRMRYCIYLNTSNVQIYEFGVLKATIALTTNQLFYYRISSPSAAGGSIIYEYSTGLSYSTLYTSTLLYDGTTDLYPDFAVTAGHYLEHHPPKTTS
jgi:hypothetical protein